MKRNRICYKSLAIAFEAMQLDVGVLYWIERIAFKMRVECVAIEIETIT